LKHYINAFGEEVIIDNADQAIAEACRQTGAAVKDYTAAPVYFSAAENGGHEWLIAFDREPPSLEEFILVLDKSLQQINSDYEAKRHKDIALRLPIVQAVAPHTFENWLRHKGKLGGQHKVPRLSNERDTLEEIKRFIQEEA
jgi:hypothetical protein